MAPEQDLQTRIEPSAAAAPTDAPRPARRSGRGHRGRGRHRRPRGPRKEGSPSPEALPSEVHSTESAVPQTETPQQEPFQGGDPEDAALRDSPEPVSTPARRGQPPSKRNVEEAIEQVNQIINSLKESLEQMDEVLELLECFERQGDADERELEALRRALRQLQRPRDGGYHHRGQLG